MECPYFNTRVSLISQGVCDQKIIASLHPWLLLLWMLVVVGSISAAKPHPQGRGGRYHRIVTNIITPLREARDSFPSGGLLLVMMGVLI
jgi:hypothetical protein